MDQAVVLSEPPSPLVRGSEVQRGSNMLEPLGTLFKPPTDLFEPRSVSLLLEFGTISTLNVMISMVNRLIIALSMSLEPHHASLDFLLTL